jgi:hypothetical protein
MLNQSETKLAEVAIKTKTNTTRIPRFAYWTLATLVVITMAAALVKCGQQLPAELSSVRLVPLLCALLLWISYAVLNAFGWALILRWLGTSVSVPAAMYLRIRCEALRWLPGSVWNFGARSIQGSSIGVPRTVGIVSILSELAFAMSAATIFLCTCCYIYAKAFGDAAKQISDWQIPPTLLLGALALTTLLAILTCFSIWRHKLHTAWSALASTLGQMTPNLVQGALLQLFYISLTTLNGCALLGVVRSFAFAAEIPTLAVIGASAVAWLVGFLTIVAPGAIVVREGTLATILSV